LQGISVRAASAATQYEYGPGTIEQMSAALLDIYYRVYQAVEKTDPSKVAVWREKFMYLLPQCRDGVYVGLRVKSRYAGLTEASEDADKALKGK